MTDIAFVDIETGGLNPERHPLIEVAIRQWPEEELIHFSVPFDLADCSPQAIEIAKLHERLPELLEIKEHVFDAIGILSDSLDKRVFVGNNPQFDANFLKHFIKRGGLALNCHYHLVDIKALVAGRFRLQPPWTTDEIAEYAKVALPEGQHTAVADCEWNREVFESLHLLPKGV